MSQPDVHPPVGSNATRTDKRFLRDQLLGLGVPAGAARSHPAEPPHVHDFIELALVESGHAVHLTAAGEQRISRGDLIAIRPGAWHTYRDYCSLGVFNVFIAVEILRRELSWLADDRILSHLLWTGPLASDAGGVAHCRLDEKGTLACIAALEGLAHADQDQAPAVERIGRLLLVLSRIAEAGKGGPVVPVEVHPAVGAAMHMMEGDLALPWSLCGLARRVGLSRSHLVRRWRQATGMSPLAYLNRCRAERAAFLLAQTDRSIGDIAATVGWPDPAHFARRFRSIQGISASAYRQRFRHEPHDA